MPSPARTRHSPSSPPLTPAHDRDIQSARGDTRRFSRGHSEVFNSHSADYSPWIPSRRRIAISTALTHPLLVSPSTRNRTCCRAGSCCACSCRCCGGCCCSVYVAPRRQLGQARRRCCRPGGTATARCCCGPSRCCCAAATTAVAAAVAMAVAAAVAAAATEAAAAAVATAVASVAQRGKEASFDGTGGSRIQCSPSRIRRRYGRS